MKPIHFNLYDPTSGFHFFGKPKANTPAQYQVIYCSNCDQCPFYKVGQCIMVGPLSPRCPYGKYEVVEGPTKRAKNYSTWLLEKSKKFEGVPYLKSASDKLALVGELVYIPYAHASMNESVPFSYHSKFLISGVPFVKFSEFTLDTIKNIVDFRPQAFFGGEITSYQKEEVPKFIAHLEEVFPDLYAKFVEKYPEYVQRYNLSVKNYVGRKAFLKTISPCTFETKGSRDGSYKVKWQWDGKTLRTNKADGYYAYNSTWGDIQDIEGMVLMLTPSEKTIITITNNTQVNKNTIFID